MPPGSTSKLVICTLRGRDVAAVVSQLDASPARWDTHVWVESADETATKVADEGGSVIADPFDAPDSAARTAILTDPSDAVFRVWFYWRRVRLGHGQLRHG